MNGKLAKKIRAQTVGYHPSSERQYVGNVVEKAKKHIENATRLELPDQLGSEAVSPYPPVTIKPAVGEPRKHYQLLKARVLHSKRAEL